MLFLSAKRKVTAEISHETSETNGAGRVMENFRGSSVIIHVMIPALSLP